MSRRTTTPAASTIRGRRHKALRAQGFAVYRVTLHEDQLSTLVRDGRLTDHQLETQACVERALTEILAIALPPSLQ